MAACLLSSFCHYLFFRLITMSNCMEIDGCFNFAFMLQWINVDGTVKFCHTLKPNYITDCHIRCCQKSHDQEGEYFHMKSDARNAENNHINTCTI